MKNYLSILFALFLFNSIAQTDKEKTIYDSLTDQYTQEGIWDSVIDIAKESIYKGHDFYEIRMRLANAYEKEGNFRLAEKNYKLAQAFLPSDIESAKKSFLMAQKGHRSFVATERFASYDPAQQEAILKLFDTEEKLPLKHLSHIKASLGYSFTNTDKEDLFRKANTILSADGLVRESQSMAQLQAGGQISNAIQWGLAYNYKQIDGYQLFETRNRPEHTGDFQIAQNEFFGELGFSFGDNWNLKLNGMYVLNNQEYVNYNIDSIGYIIPSDIEDSVLIDDLFIDYDKNSQSDDAYVFGLSLNRKVNILDFSIFASYAHVFDVNPFQLGGELTILPNGNYHLYVTNQVYWYHDDMDDRAIYKVLVGGDLYKNFDFIASATFGNLQYTKDPNQAMFYNLTEETKYVGDLALCYHFNEQFSLSLKYQILQKNGDYEYYAYDGLQANTDYPGYYHATYNRHHALYKFTEHQFFFGLYWQF